MICEGCGKDGKRGHICDGCGSTVGEDPSFALNPTVATLRRIATALESIAECYSRGLMVNVHVDQP